jgi:hypothetical protein
VGEREGSCYFSMKFVEGGQLDELPSAVQACSRCKALLGHQKKFWRRTFDKFWSL